MRIITNKDYKNYMLELEHLKGEIQSKNIDIEYLEKDVKLLESKNLDILYKLYDVENDLKHTVSKKTIKAKVQEIIKMLGGKI